MSATWWQRARRWLASPDVCGMNRRNLALVLPRNERRHFGIADDKLLTKRLLSAEGIQVAPTLAVFDSFRSLERLEAALDGLDSFAVKPARGHGGEGILIIARRRAGELWTAGGRPLTFDALRRHIADIIFGVYTLDRPDVAIVEPRLRPAPFFEALYPRGLSDIRVIAVDEKLTLSMIRVPTDAADGRANLHQGAIGVAVDLDTGATYRAVHRRKPVERHPDTGAPLTGQVVPHWPRLRELALRAARAVPLKFLGLDFVVDAELGPVLLEINARPGMEIQNVTGVPLRRRLRTLGVEA